MIKRTIKIAIIKITIMEITMNFNIPMLIIMRMMMIVTSMVMLTMLIGL